MMQAMRERVKVIYWVVILSFIGLMFLGWGIGDWDSPQMSASDESVAKVDGQSISFFDWERRTQSILASMRARSGGEVSESDVLRARDQAFDELVDETIQVKEAERLGIRVTDQEITDILRNDPPAFLLQQFMGPNGQPDVDAYYAALDDPANDWSQVREVLRATLPLQKLNQRIASAAIVGEVELRQMFAEQSTRMVAEWIGVRFTDVTLEDETVTDEQANAWYQEHLDEYKQQARVAVRLVKVDKAPSEADEQDVLSILGEIRGDIIAGRTTFEEAARTYSEDGSADVGGDLGYFDRNRMVEPFTEAAFALAVGDLSEPVRTQFGYHVIECTDERLDDKGERTEMRARHILLRLQAGQETVDRLREQAEALHTQARREGLETAAAAAGLEVVTTPPFQEGFNIPGVNNSLPGSRFAFTSGVGALSPMLETEEAIYMVEVAEKLPAGHRTLEEVRSLVDSAVLRERRSAIASEQLRSALAGVDPQLPLGSIAAATGLQHAVTDTFTVRENIADIGFGTAFARVALESEVGQLRTDVRTPRGVYVLRLLYKSPFDQDAFRAERSQLAQTMLFSRQRMLLQQWIEQKREDAQIVDHRAQLL
jgi:peptidyl-prolyl cis-trans isomerase D